MHIADGVLSTPVILSTSALALLSVGWSFKTLETDELPKIAMFSALFFIFSLIHFPLGPISIHLSLTGLIGILLGYKAFSTLFIALLMQALLFGHGGISTLGANIVILGSGAMGAFFSFKLLEKRLGYKIAALIAGGLSVVCSTVLLTLALAFSSEVLISTAKAAFIANLPLIFLEAFISMIAMTFIHKTMPGLMK